ncbi:DUF5347 family protein [Providencia rettgeri]|nr:DUF5347 family protein [Providencia rettgeri]ELR5279274.1 DUF5347 family protein [Providencia rettgeri]
MTTETTQKNSELRAIKRDEHRMPFFDRVIEYTLDEKIDQLNHCAKLRGALFKGTSKVKGKIMNQGLIEFIKDLNSAPNNRERKNKRVISLIYFLADITKDKHSLNYNQLSEDEQVRLVEAINQLKAISSILPTDLAIK